jgi:DNA-binding NarL/FixJ family response regulator
VLLVELPPLLRDILEHAVRSRTDCELLPGTRGMRELFVEPTVVPDVVVLSAREGRDPTLVSSFLEHWPHAQIVTVTERGDSAEVFELRPHRHRLVEQSPAEIIEAMRRAARSRQPWRF